MIIEYTTSKRADKETLKKLDKGAKAAGQLVIEAARVVAPKLVPLVWLMTLICFRTVTDKSVKYNYFLLK